MKKIINLLKQETGNITIIVSVIMLAIIISLALVIDIGVVYAEKSKLSNAIDAALLAGGQELPSDVAQARIVMEEYLLKNGVSPQEATIIIAADGLSAEIIGKREIPFYFAKVMGINETSIEENSKLILGTASSAKGGIRPFGVEKKEFIYGDEVVLKTDSGNGNHGNYGPISLGGRGAWVFLNNALYGYDVELNVGDFIFTEPGNMAGMVNQLSYYINSIDETFETFTSGSDRIWTIPIFENVDVNGRKAIQIVGFAQFFVESITKVRGKAVIYGRFIEYVTNGDIDTNISNTGVYGMKLVD